MQKYSVDQTESLTNVTALNLENGYLFWSGTPEKGHSLSKAYSEPFLTQKPLFSIPATTCEETISIGVSEDYVFFAGVGNDTDDSILSW